MLPAFSAPTDFMKLHNFSFDDDEKFAVPIQASSHLDLQDK